MTGPSVRHAAARMAAIALIGVLLSVWPIYFVTGFNQWICLAIALVVWGFGWYVVATAHKGKAAYDDVQAWQRKVWPNEGMCWIPQRHFRRLQRLLKESSGGRTKVLEDEVKLVCRRHWRRLVELIVLPILAALVCLVGAVLLAVWHNEGSYPYGEVDTTLPDPLTVAPTPLPPGRGPFILPPPGSYEPPRGWPYELPLPVDGSPTDLSWSIPWWLPPLGLVIAAVLFGILAWALSWRWSYTYYWITNLHVAIISAPPPSLLTFMKRELEVLQLERVRRVQHTIRGIGTLIGEGSVSLDTELDTDMAFVPLRYVPNPVQFEAVAEAQRLLLQERD